MITNKKYIILQHIPVSNTIEEELCIIDMDIIANFDKLKNFIKENKNTTFWIVTNNFSKEYISIASELQIQNILSHPIKKDLIEDFFLKKENNITPQKNAEEFLPLNNSKILIVDDNPLNLKLLTDILKPLKIDITASISGNESLEIIQNKKFDMLVLDILMPDITGFEIAASTKNTINSGTPIIFISAINGTENILNAYNLGACSYIEKPFDNDIVKRQIYNLLKRTEEQKNIDKEKEHFVATLTHDLKSPINAEITALNLLINQNTEPDLKEELLTELLNSAEYMKNITDKILCHYKQKNSAISLSKEDFSLYDSILSSINELKYLAIEKNIKVSFETKLISDNIFADKLEIKRVINNLLSNAIEYSKRDGTISITLDKKDNYFIFSIKDNGLGINTTNHPDIFQEYITLAKEHKKTGYGLGLNICKNIIEAHNGSITINSEENQGTIITFKLPITK